MTAAWYHHDARLFQRMRLQAWSQLVEEFGRTFRLEVTGSVTGFVVGRLSYARAQAKSPDRLIRACVED